MDAATQEQKRRYGKDRNIQIVEHACSNTRRTEKKVWKGQKHTDSRTWMQKHKRNRKEGRTRTETYRQLKMDAAT